MALRAQPLKMGMHQITGVENGVDPNDAVNKSQLDAAIAATELAIASSVSAASTSESNAATWASAASASATSAAAAAVSCAYANTGGQGDRTATVTATASSLVASGTPSNLVDGGVGDNTTDALKFSASAVAAHYLRVDFGPGAARVIQEVTFKQSTTASHGTWQIQGSNDKITWVSIGATFTLGGSTSQTITTPSGNGTGYRYYQLLGVSGTASSTPWIREIEFKIGATILDAFARPPVSGTKGQILMKASDTSYDVAWMDPSDFLLKAARRREIAIARRDADRRRREDNEGQLSYYVKSGTLGSDAADGLGKSTPKLTIAGLLALSPGATDSVGLVVGSSWREMLKPASGLKRIMSVGIGTPPILDGADVISAGSFTQNATYPATTYDVSLTRDSAGVYVSGDTYMMWENGAWLVRVASLAAVDATAGTFYIASFNATASPSVANVHPFGNTDPRSDGKTYEYSKRSTGVEGTAYNKTIVEGIHSRRSMGAYGVITGGRDSIIRRCIAAYGGKHNIICKSGLMEDVIAYEWEVGRSILADGGRIPFTWYQSDPSYLDWHMRRCMAIMPTGRSDDAQCIYCHGSSGTPGYHNKGTVEGFISLRAGSVEGILTEQYLNDVCSLDNATAMTLTGKGTTISVKRPLIRGTGNATLINHPSAGALSGAAIEVCDGGIDMLTATGTAIAMNIASVDNVHHNTIRRNGAGNFASLTLSTAGSYFKNNILVSNIATAIRWINVSSSVTCDYNVYIDLQVGASTLYWQQGASSYFSLALWRAGTGQDTNSILLTPTEAEDLFLNGVAGITNGDFRLNPRCLLTFVDGTPIVGNAGPREYYDWNTRAVLAGQPFSWPTPPDTETLCAQYIADPHAWNFYPTADAGFVIPA